MKDRIAEIISYKGLTASRFADIIDIQRSRISHIMSGRNNPSIEVVTHIIEKFPEINLNWLMTGNGEMLNNQPDMLDFSKPDEPKREVSSQKQPESNPYKHLAGSKDIDRIIVFYKDDSFKEYRPE